MPDAVIRKTFERGQGVLRLIPTFVPRRFARPGRRLRLHYDDYYAYGMARGAIKERWFSSVTPAINGPLARPDEGLSYVMADEAGRERFLLRDAVNELRADLIGDALWRAHHNWPMYAKFFDYRTPLFHHLHLSDKAAARVGRCGKPEAYFFPPQYNPHLGDFPVTYFGFDPDVTREQVQGRLSMFGDSDNRITELSRAFRIELGTGWYTPPGVVHAPGSVLTYEPQWNSDVNSVYENVVDDEIFPYDFLVENCPADKRHDMDYVMSLMDWEANVDPHYRQRFFRPPRQVHAGTSEATQRWVVYGNPYFGAIELSVPPNTTVTVSDAAPYGCIIVQGHGRFGPHPAEAAGILRFGQCSADEFFVGQHAASQGVCIANHSPCEPLVMLKHFGPNHTGPKVG